MEPNWKDPNKIEGDLSGTRPPVNLRHISGKSPGCHSDTSGRGRAFVRQVAKISFSPYDLRRRLAPVVISGKSPVALRVDRLAGRMCSKPCCSRLTYSLLPPVCLYGPGGLATAAPSLVPGEAFLGIARYREEKVALLPGNILSPRGRASRRGANAPSNRWAIPRSVRPQPCQPLKFQVIACARGSDGR
jgi:hypothetical protein